MIHNSGTWLLHKLVSKRQYLSPTILLYHGDKNNMELRHLQFLTLVRQSTGNRRLDIWWQKNKSLFLLPCQGKCPKKQRVKLTFVYLFVCLLKYTASMMF